MTDKVKEIMTQLEDDKFTDSEKKEFLQSFVERVDVFPEGQPGGRFLKRIKFRFPVYFDGAEVENMRWDNEMTVESIVCLSKLADTHIELENDPEELDTITVKGSPA